MTGMNFSKILMVCPNLICLGIYSIAVVVWSGSVMADDHGRQQDLQPQYVGVESFWDQERLESGWLSLDLRYLTAEQMREKFISLTGYDHPGFKEFASIIGAYSPANGRLTNDRPTVLSVTILGKLVGELARRVVARERFLDREYRVVFANFDLDHSPEIADLIELIQQICSDAFYLNCPEPIQQSLITSFRSIEQDKGLDQALVGLLSYIYQIGAVYYY